MSDAALLLQQIANNTARDDSLWIAAVAGGAAVLGAMVSAVASYFATARTVKSQSESEREKLHASIVTSERLRWLRDLRSKVATFYTQIEMQLSHLERSVAAPNSADFQRTLDSYSLEVMNNAYAILLMLDRETEEQAILYSSLNEALAFLRDSFAKKTYAPMVVDKTTIKAIKQNSLDALEIVGRKAWKKVQELR